MLIYFRLFALGIIMFSLYNNQNVTPPFYLLTLFYIILVSFQIKYQKYYQNLPGISVFNIVAFFRYSIVPLAYYLSDDSYFVISSKLPTVYESIYLMIYEMLCVYITLLYVSKRKYAFIAQGEACKKNIKVFKTNIIFVLFTLIIMAITFSSTSIKSGMIALLSGGVGELYVMDKVENMSFKTMAFRFIWSSTIAWIYTYCIFKLYEVFKKKKSIKIVVCAILVTLFLIVLTFVNQVGGTLARWQAIVFGSAGVFLLLKLFYDSRNLILYSLLIPCALSLCIITIFKNAGYVEGGKSSFQKAALSVLDPKGLDEYFAGPLGVADGIQFKEKSDMGIKNMFNDFIDNAPIFSHYFDSNETTSVQYNKNIGTLGSIIPLVTQSSIYFGYLFAPLLSIISIFLICFCDSRFNTQQGYSCYIYAFVSCWFALEASMLNFTIICSWFYLYIIPMILFFVLSKQFIKNIK